MKLGTTKINYQLKPHKMQSLYLFYLIIKFEKFASKLKKKTIF